MGRSFAFTLPSKSALLGAVSFLCLVSLLNLRSVAFSVLYRTKRTIINVHNDPNSIEFKSFLEYNNNTTLLPCIRPNFKGPNYQPVNKSLSISPSKLDELGREFPHVKDGGHWEPEDCLQRQHLGILIPFRDRWDQLPILLRQIHLLLTKQLRHYTIYVIEQNDLAAFNRGKLLNVGVIEALKIEPDINCFILHDVDTVPQYFRTIYKCHEDRRLALQMATYQKKRNYRIAYKGYTGGVLAVWREQYEAINGLSNEFWGWGGEDDDLGNRLRGKGFDVARDFSRRSASFYSLSHPFVDANPNRTIIIKDHENHLYREGLNTTDYTLVTKREYRLFTLFSVKIN